MMPAAVARNVHASVTAATSATPTTTGGTCMTLGTDQLDAWTRTLTECDELYRELQLLIRINPEAYPIGSDALATVAIANSEAWDDGGMIHPVAFARYWAWHLAAEHKSIPPITNNWVTLIRYVSAHLQYLGRDEREWFADELRRLRGMLGALVNENGLAQGEAEDLQKINARQAREELRERVTQINMPLSREDLHIIWPELIEEHWHRLRARKQADEPNLGRGMFRPSWVSGVVASGHPNLVLGEYAHRGYEDVYDDRRRLVSYEALRDSVLAADGQR